MWNEFGGEILGYLLIDERMRSFEKQTLRDLGYELIEIKKSDSIYPEISSHVDIFTCKIGNKIVAEKNIYQNLKRTLKNTENDIVLGASFIKGDYPNDINYNVCIVGNKAIHNFKYTDSQILYELKKNGFEMINVKQGYSNCSIAVIDENSVILSDRGLYNSLKISGLDILFLDYVPDIKLLNENREYSKKNGFIGGTIARVGENVIVFGDLGKIDYNGSIREFINNKGFKIIDFKGLDVIDYGRNCRDKIN